MQRTHLETQAQASRHNRLKHKEASAKLKTPGEAAPLQQETPTVDPVGGEFFSCNASMEYFRHCASGGGVSYLVAKAALRDHSKMNRITKEDVQMFMSFSHFVATLTRPQREQFATVSNEISLAGKRHDPMMAWVPKGRPSKKFKSGNELPDLEPIKVPVPRAKESMRRMIMEGKNALFSNPPHPEVHKVGEHAYVLPSECIADLMAHGRLNHRQKRSQLQSLGESLLARSFSVANDSDSIQSIFTGLWSDDFEPNYSTNANRGSVWTMTMTIQTHKSHNPSMYHVCLVAVGPSKVDHREVERKIFDDLAKLRRKDDAPPVTMWDGSTKSNRAVSVHLLAVVQDQPERRRFNRLLLGGSGTHPRFGWRCEWLHFVENMAPCHVCRGHLVSGSSFESDWERLDCPNCHNWMQNPESMSFQLPAHCPMNESAPGEMMISTSRLTHDMLSGAVDKAHDKVSKQEWTLQTMRAYLQTYCLNQEVVDAVGECAKNVGMHLKAIEENHAETTAACKTLQQEEPHLHQKWKSYRFGLPD